MVKVIALDLGPEFIGQRLQTNGELVCVLNPFALTDPGIQEEIRDMMERQGTDCKECRGCPVGRAQ